MPYVTSIERNAEQRGLRQGTLQGIEVGLELKFGQDGLRLLPEISKISDLEILEAIQIGLRQASTIDELRSIYKDGIDS